MINALGIPQHLLLLGGTSDIALAIAEAYAAQAPGLAVTLAARPGDRSSSLPKGARSTQSTSRRWTPPATAL